MSDTPPPDKALISLQGVDKSFGDIHVLQGMDLEVPTGCTTVILGPSGAGKSVTLKLIIGLLKPDAGRVWALGEQVDQLPEHRLVDIRRRIGFLFQQGALFDSMSVLENISFPLREHTTMNAAQRRQAAEEVLTLLGIEACIDRLPSELSGGQRKRVALARSIVQRPECILYDEPTTGLDPIRSDVVAHLLNRLQKVLGGTSVVVTHDIPLAFKIADHMVLLREGHSWLSGPPDIFNQSDDPVVRSFLDGKATAEDLRAMESEHAA